MKRAASIVVHVSPHCHFCGTTKSALFVPVSVGLICAGCIDVSVEVLLTQHAAALKREKRAKKPQLRMVA